MIQKNDPRITSFVMGELDPAESEIVSAAIEASPELQAVVTEIRESAELLKSEFAAELKNSTVGLPIENPVKRPKIASSSRRLKWIWITAATVLVAVLGYAAWRPAIQFSREVVSRNDSGTTLSDLSEEPNIAVNGFLPPSNEHRFAEKVPDGGAVLLGGIKRESSPESAFPQAENRAGLPVNPAPQRQEGLSYPAPEEWRDKVQRRRKFQGMGILGNAVDPSLQVENDENADNGRFFDIDRMGGGMGGMSGSGENEYLYGDTLGRRRGLALNDRYDSIIENEFLRPINDPLSTFSIDVDTAAYSKVRSYLMNYNQLPPAGSVRIEELINYFRYSYAPPIDDVPFAAHQAVAACPWNPQHKLVRIAIKGREISQDKRPVSNLVFLLDVSGSMNESNKLPLVKRGIQMLVDQLTENDRVAIVVYAGAAGKVLDSTTGDQKSMILGALDRLQAGGSTNGGDGIRLAYQMAIDNFITGGVNRVILCTDGDFNVGTTSNDGLISLVEEQAKKNVFLSVLGFGMGNLNDSMLEQISNRGNGNYAFIDTDAEARKVLVEQLSGTLITIAKDVKIQVEFNPARVGAYRLIGYENRVMAAQDFNDDKKDAGEIGAGHTVTALYEIIPADVKVDLGAAVDELKYQIVPERKSATVNDSELLTLKLRFKQPDGDVSQLLEFPLTDSDRPFADADQDFQFAAAVASFGMQLRNSKHAGQTSMDAALEIAQSASQSDPSGYRREFLDLVRAAKGLKVQK